MQSSPAGADPVEDLMARWLAEPASERAALLERLCAEETGEPRRAAAKHADLGCVTGNIGARLRVFKN